jgi:adenylate kinase
MKILVAGLPGSGKTTQAKRIAEKLDIPFITTGDALRDLAMQDSELGKKVKAAVESGQLVDDEIVSQVIQEKVNQPESQKGFVMDGYPRTVQQLSLFDPEFDKIFYLNVSPTVAEKRLLTRGRIDDKSEVIGNRFKAQLEKLAEVVNNYRAHVGFKDIDGEKPIDVISQEIMENLK